MKRIKIYGKHHEESIFKINLDELQKIKHYANSKRGKSYICIDTLGNVKRESPRP